MNKGLSFEETVRLIKNKPSSYWEKERERVLLRVFHSTAKRVPAYKHFLKSHGITVSKVKTFEDFLLVPPTTKDNYLRKYDFSSLCVDGSLKQPIVFTSTSGSTGAPFYFPRNGLLDHQSSIYHELFLENAGVGKNSTTLVIICFGMGVWIGGLITYEAFKGISERGYPLTVITPGINKNEIFEAIKNLGSRFDNLILCGYPPFIKDLIDEASSQDIKWGKYNVKIVLAAETFSEKFRDYIVAKVGIKNRFTDVMNIYGSADLGTMAEETPISVLIRRMALQDNSLYENIFTDVNRLPTLAQFNPQFTNFEAINNKIYCTGNSVLPLVRYEIGDHGGVLSFRQIEEIFETDGLSLRQEAKNSGLKNKILELPFVYIYERADLSTKLYGAIIYPEHIREALHSPELHNYITGKFTIFTNYTKNQNEYLEVNIELKPRMRGSEKVREIISREIVSTLCKRSSEYKNNIQVMPERAIPKVVFWSHEHPTHFKVGTKQKWIKNKR